MSELVHLVHLLFALLEPPEVVLDEERGVELADRYLVVAGRWHHLVQQLLTGALPHLLDHRTQLLVRLVDVTCSGNTRRLQLRFDFDSILIRLRFEL